ncbi:helix-turn-helix domain-containing protein [Nitrobacter sp.]|uniref:helix-turn-helix domain-containing protein n=1 Tax=Nitrobacter sp. TaxID=29420 RepID=UPI0029CABDA2|nr:helix-turn-helix domain-containing protein [Nitrobacter sp.]
MKTCRIPSQHSVRATIETLLRQGDPSLQHAAHRLGISSRSLQRHLAGMGTSYSEIVAEVRLETACHLLAESDQSIASIAGRLGYSGASSFSRIFMRLMKIPPIAYRRQQTARRINRGSVDSSHSARRGRSEQAE